MNSFSNRDGRLLVEGMITVIQNNAVLLSDLDGVIGDGDHGVNMGKGFSLCARRLEGSDWDLTAGLQTLGTVLLEEIGGAMGPLYGSFFTQMALVTGGRDIDAPTYSAMLNSGLKVIIELGGAQVGDKTLVDTLAPAVSAFDAEIARGGTFSQALDQLAHAAERGKDSTKDLVAKIGRASRLGERSRGMLDTGAVSCWLLLGAMTKASQTLLGHG